MTVLRMFKSPTCAPCREALPQVEQILANYGGDVKLEILDISNPEALDLAKKSGVRVVPTFMNEDGKIIAGAQILKQPLEFMNFVRGLHNV